MCFVTEMFLRLSAQSLFEVSVSLNTCLLSQFIFKCSSPDSELFINCIFHFLHSKGNTMARVLFFLFAELSSVCVAGLFLRVREFTGFSGSTRNSMPLQPPYLFRFVVLFISLCF